MAQHTVTIYGSASVRIDALNPNTNDHTQTVIDVGDRYFGLEQFEIPEEMIGCKFVSATLYVYAKKGTGWGTVLGNAGIRAIAERWDPLTVTYNNAPNIYGEAFQDGFDWTGLTDSYAWRSFNIENESNAALGGNMVSYGFHVGQYVMYQTSNSDNKPYMVVTYDDTYVGLRVSDTYPTNGSFVDNKKGAALRWIIGKVGGEVIGEPTLSETTIIWYWQEDNKNLFTLENPNDTTYTISPNQLPETGNVNWGIHIKISSGGFLTLSGPYFSVTDSTGTAIPISPINEYVDGAEPIRFVWDWNISTGTKATKADFQVSNNGGSSWTALGSVDGEIPYVADPGTLPDGNVQWQVRGYNSDDVAGPWSSSANIVVRQAPAAPYIENATPVPKPTVTWQSVGQQAYQLQAGDWDSGPVFGTVKSAQVEEFLPAGQAKIRLRVQNSFGLWSPWSEITITIVNTPGEPIVLNAQQVNGGVKLSWGTNGEYPSYYVYQDGNLIGTTVSQPFTDYRTLGEHEYFVRGVNSDSTYTQSNTVSATTSPRWGMIAVDGEWNWIELKFMRGSFVTLNDNRQANVSYAYYSGRSLPVAEISGTKSRQISVTYSLKKSDLEALYGMLGQLVIYKDRRTICRGVLDNVTTTSDWCNDASITITEVDDGT